ncbi:MAG: sugar O-acetyltransferase [Hyphomicrobiales bacterium]
MKEARASAASLSEKKKMLANMHYEHLDAELTAERERAADLTFAFNATRDREVGKRRAILSDLIGRMGADCEIKAPFKCDYGYNIELGDRVFMNYGCVLLDCNRIVIGSDTLLAPGVQISAAYHPTDYEPRRRKLEAAAPVVIGSNVWIGAGAIICPGVTIGDDTTIGAGSVVTRDIPARVVAAGNPCRVIRELD